MRLDGLPRAEIIQQGVRDLAAGVDSPAALLVLVGEPRLRRIGIVVPTPPWAAESGFSPEHRLYDVLAASDSRSAHSRYNALLRTLVSFERAAECAS
jgi:hypothetical protein